MKYTKEDVLRITAETRTKLESEDKPNAVSLAIQNLKSCDDGKKEIANLVSEIFKELGHEIEIKLIDDHEAYPWGCCVVPLDNPNGHGYTIGAPVVVMNDADEDGDSNECLKFDGRTGDYLRLKLPHTRLATEDDIGFFFMVYTRTTGKDYIDI